MKGSWTIEALEEHTATAFRGDCVEVMKRFPANTFDSIVVDPPYGLSFMNQDFDKLGDGQAQQAWHQRWAEEALRVLKPGGHLLAFGGTRLYHRLACGIEDAGFEIRDSVWAWVYGSGFPKSKNIALAIDKGEGHPNRGRAIPTASTYQASDTDQENKLTSNPVPTYEPKSEAAKAAEGWGSALKPSVEPICVARKPLSGTLAQNYLEHGTGGINVDGCRISSDGDHKRPFQPTSAEGRWPANSVFAHHPDCRQVGVMEVKSTKSSSPGTVRKNYSSKGGYGMTKGAGGYGGDSGTETVEQWACAEDCHVAELDKQSGFSKSIDYQSYTDKPTLKNEVYGKGFGGPLSPHNRHTDAGGASRFFYCPKASRSEREEGCEHLTPRSGAEAVEREEGTAGLRSPRAGAGRTADRVKNHHPCIKPINLLRWLTRLVTPKGGMVLDCFGGSGSMAVAAVAEGFRSVSIEQDPDYVRIAEARIQHALNKERQSVFNFGKSYTLKVVEE